MNNRQEKADVSFKKIFITAGILIVLFVIIIFALYNIFWSGNENQIYNSVLQPGSRELRELRANAIKALNSYDMLDEQNGVVQIPIERAMKLIAEEAYKDSKQN